MGRLWSMSRLGYATSGWGTRLGMEVLQLCGGQGAGGGQTGALLRLISPTQAGASAQAAGGGPGAGRCPQPLPLPPSEEERREGLVELHTSFRELVTFFCTNATIHGTIRLVCSSQNRLKTATWALLLAGALSALYWQFGLLFQQYWRYPVVMAVSVHSERKLFPSVTRERGGPRRRGPGLRACLPAGPRDPPSEAEPPRRPEQGGLPTV